MKEYTLSQQYALIALDGMDSLNWSLAKKAAVRGIAAAKLLENILRESEEEDTSALEEKLISGMKEVKKIKKHDRDLLEKEMADFLKKDGVLDEVPDLLACDINYYTSGIDIKDYRSDKDLYLRITESLRAEILEEGPVTRECFSILWLLRESGCLYDIFSGDEHKQINSRMSELSITDAFCKILWKEEFYSNWESISEKYLRAKSNLFKNLYLEGVNLLFPFLDRRKAIFVDYVILGTNVESRRVAMISFLTEKGHYVEEVKNGTETFLKIDNAYYRIFPYTLAYVKIPIQGAYLLPVYR